MAKLIPGTVWMDTAEFYSHWKHISVYVILCSSVRASRIMEWNQRIRGSLAHWHVGGRHNRTLRLLPCISVPVHWWKPRALFCIYSNYPLTWIAWHSVPCRQLRPTVFLKKLLLTHLTKKCFEFYGLIASSLIPKYICICIYTNLDWLLDLLDSYYPKIIAFLLTTVQFTTGRTKSSRVIVW